MSADYYVKRVHPTPRLGDAERILDATLAAAAEGRFIPVPSEAIGAVGVSGDAADKDEYAIASIYAAGFARHPAEPAPNWREARL
jgi:uncharacterized protein GlcG (DUF336 family)